MSILNITAFQKCDKGGIAILTVFGLVPLIAAAALAVDLNHVYTERSRLQIAADAAALAAVKHLPNTSAAKVAAIDFATRNMPAESHGGVLAEDDIEIGNWNSELRSFTPDTSPLNAVRVVTRRSDGNGNSFSLLFARVFGIDQMELIKTATAASSNGPALCLLALEPTESKSINLSGGSVIDAVDCRVQNNSSSDKAYNMSGGSTSAADICITGDYNVSGGAFFDPSPTVSCDAVPDPLESWSAPSDPVVCDHHDLSISGGTVTLSPGKYCGGLTMSGGGRCQILSRDILY